MTLNQTEWQIFLLRIYIYYYFEGYSLDRIKMTKWIWPKSVNMTEKLTRTNINMVNMTKNIINITTTTNINGWIWPKIESIINITTTSNINGTNWSVISSGVFLISVPDIFFSCRGAKQGWAGVPASASLRAGAGGPAYYQLMFVVVV